MCLILIPNILITNFNFKNVTYVLDLNENLIKTNRIWTQGRWPQLDLNVNAFHNLREGCPGVCVCGNCVVWVRHNRTNFALAESPTGRKLICAARFFRKNSYYIKVRLLTCTRGARARAQPPARNFGVVCEMWTTWIDFVRFVVCVCSLRLFVYLCAGNYLNSTCCGVNM